MSTAWLDRKGDWLFVVTWDPERGGDLPAPILRLFTYHAAVAPGVAIVAADEWHVRFYVTSVDDYLRRYYPDRLDIGLGARPA